MPSYAYIDTELKCPNCDVVVTDVVAFQWGFCPGYGPRSAHLYRLGDRVKWHRLSNGEVPSWTYFRDNGGNLGDATVVNLFTQDELQFGWDDPGQQRQCSSCGSKFEGAIVEIRNGCLMRAWIYQKGEFDHTVSYHVIQENGSLQLMPEWNDHPMPLIHE